MDINETKLPSHSWNLEMSMEDHIIHDEIPLHPIWPSYPLQNLQNPSSSSTTNTISSQIPTATTVYSTDHDQISPLVEDEEEPEEELSAMKEMVYKIAAMQPVDIDPATIRKPKRRNVRISDDPQSVAARHRRERISEKIRILQRLVPGGTKMDTASMLDEAIRYVKFLKRQIRVLQQSNNHVEWQVTPNKPLVVVSTTSSASLQVQAASAAPPPAGFSFAANGGNSNPLCFNNHEVISD